MYRAVINRSHFRATVVVTVILHKGLKSSVHV